MAVRGWTPRIGSGCCGEPPKGCSSAHGCSMPTGIVSVVHGARCEVLDNGSSLPCLLRGRLKQAASSLVAGDRVQYERVDAHLGVVEDILPRRNQLARSSRERPRRRSAGAVQEQVVLANPDQVVFVA